MGLVKGNVNDVAAPSSHLFNSSGDHKNLKRKQKSPTSRVKSNIERKYIVPAMLSYRGGEGKEGSKDKGKEGNALGGGRRKDG